jgi:hypothetical protein
MAEASLISPLSDIAESSTAVMFSRNDDPMTRVLRSNAELAMDDLINLNRQLSPSPVDVCSSGTLTTAVFSSHEPSTVTKPTSAGTSYPLDDYKGKGKAVATYASSLSADHGSGSDNELDCLQDNMLIGVGHWVPEGPVASRVLRGYARAGKRPRQGRHSRSKKPVVVIQQHYADSASEEDNVPGTHQVSCANSKDRKYLRHRRNNRQSDELLLAEEGRFDTEVALIPEHESGTLSRTRVYFLIALIIATVVTLSLSILAAHYTGKARMNCTKGIIFAATVLISGFIILAMLVARRALHEALLAGVLEFLIGFALLVEIHDFL